MRQKITYLLISFFLILACSAPNKKSSNRDYQLALPAHFPAPNIPANNPLKQEAIILGKKLFFDPILSRDSSIACNSCHLPELAFSDSVAISLGVGGNLGFRNAPTLMNLAWLEVVHKDGGVRKLDIQAMTPIEDEFEMDISILKVAKRLNQQPTYVALAQKAYQRPLDAFVITRALASYLRTLISANSKYDQYIEGDSMALSEAAISGKQLFFSSKTNCSSCHTGFNFTNNQFENNGLYKEFNDNGRERITLQPEDNGKFRVPTLRNIELTAPYMHDGSLKNIEAVIAHYNSGGKNHPNQNDLIKPLSLTPTEKQDLIAFLKSLTDTTFSGKETIGSHSYQ